MNAFNCASRKEFLELSEAIGNHVVEHGYAVIDAWDAEPAALSAIGERFGRVQSHVRADANGIVGITADPVVNQEWTAFRSEYMGTSTEEFLPHTDGTYLHGVVRAGNTYVELLPPKMLILQCTQHAAAGGGNVLIDAQRVYHRLASEQPGFVEALSRKGCVAYCRDDQIALDCAVFERLDDGAIMLRFRYDSAAYVADWALEAFHALQGEYFANPSYQMHIMLTRGQILLVDNYRMLHGRSAFTSAEGEQKRSLRRIWLARDDLPVLHNAAGEHRERRALTRFRSYAVLPSEGGFGRLRMGIRDSSMLMHQPSWRARHSLNRAAA